MRQTSDSPRRRPSALMVFLVLCACGGSDSGGNPTGPEQPTTPTVAAMTLSRDTLVLGWMGERRGLQATGFDAAGHQLAVTPTWSSSDPRVATVSADSGNPAHGSVLAVGGGTTTVSATAENVSASALVRVSLLVEMVAGYNHTCGRTAEDEVYCWGSNNTGQLGDGTTASRWVPVRVSGGLAFVEIAAGEDHTCGRTAENEVYCWGLNNTGQLGDGATVDRLVPVRVSGGLAFVEIAAGGGLGLLSAWGHTCGRTMENAVYCWGWNEDGQLGDGTSTGRLAPVPVSGDIPFIDIEAGWKHTCGRTAENAVYCWGRNDVGQLGDLTQDTRWTPVRVSGDLAFVEITSIMQHTCGRTAENKVYCWGWNRDGGLGDGTTDDRLTPVLVSGGISFVEIAAGGLHTCGRTVEDVAFCWGWNQDGQLGDSTFFDSPTPAPVSGHIAFVEIVAGMVHTCGRTAEHAVYCWGDNDQYQLGSGHGGEEWAPVWLFWQ